MVPYNRNRKYRKADLFLLILLGFSIIASSYQNLNMIGLYVFMPILILKVWYKKWKEIINNKFVRYYLALVIWIFLTCFTGIDVDYSLSHIVPIIATFLISTSMYQLALNEKNTKGLYYVYIAYYFSLLFYIYFWGELYISDSTESERAGGVAMNANNFAYYLLYLTFGFHCLLYGRSNKLLVDSIVYLLLFALTLYVSLITASRQILIIQIPFITLLVLTRFVDKRANHLVPLFLFLLALAYFVLPWFDNLYSDSLLAHRSEKAIEDDHRTWLIKRAIEVGKDNIIGGVGIGNFAKYAGGAFSHCSYTELFACTGIMGTCLYIIMLVSFVKEQFKRYQKTHDKLFVSFAFFGLLFIAANLFYVYYDTIWLIGFFFIVVGHSQQYYRSFLNSYK